MHKQTLDLACSRSATKVGPLRRAHNPISSPMSSKATVCLSREQHPLQLGPPSSHCVRAALPNRRSGPNSAICLADQRAHSRGQSATPPHTGVFFVVRALHADVDPKLMQDPIKPRDQIKHSRYHDWFIAQFWLHPLLRPRDMSLHGSIPCKRALFDQTACLRAELRWGSSSFINECTMRHVVSG